MSPEQRAAFLAARDALRRADEVLSAVLDAEAVAAPDLFDAVPLAIAAQAWAISKDSARQRARRGAGFRIRGRWYVPRAALSCHVSP